MPKGRGSNKKGGGPTPARGARPQGQQVSMAQVENQVLKSQIEDLVIQKRQLQGEVQAARSQAMAVLLTKRNHTANVTQRHMDKLVEFAGISIEEAEDGVTFTLVRRPEPETSEGVDDSQD